MTMVLAARADASGDDGPRGCPRHESVALYLPELIEGCGTRGAKGGAEHRLNQLEPIDVIF
jgi:hypothetical protein